MTHGALGESYRLLSAFLESHADTARHWSAKLGAACSDDETLSALMLNYAVRANRSGLVLFSSKKEDRIKKNVRAVADARFSVAQIDLFAKLVQHEMLVKAVAPAASK